MIVYTRTELHRGVTPSRSSPPLAQRFTLEQVEAASRPLHERIAQLEEQLRAANAA